MPTSRPHRISQKSMRFLKAQEQAGKHLGFENVRNMIYTTELERHTPAIAARIATKRAGMIAVSKGIHRGTRRHTIPVVR